MSIAVSFTRCGSHHFKTLSSLTTKDVRFTEPSSLCGLIRDGAADRPLFSLLHREKICNTTFNDKENKNRSCLCMYERTRITGWLFWHRTDRLYVVVPFTNASFGFASFLRDGGGLFGRFLLSLCGFVAFSAWPLSICEVDS